MKTTITYTFLTLALLAVGCFESFHGRDSLGNPTSISWEVNAIFASGRKEIYTLRPETFGNYTVTAKGQTLPELTNIFVTSMDSQRSSHSLTMREILKLRSASKGELRLVLYSEGFAIPSPATINALRREKTLEVLLKYSSSVAKNV
jgi:hypothetical protein